MYIFKAFMKKVDELVILLQKKGIEDKRVLDAIAQIPRDLFVPLDFKHLAYEDTAIPIEHSQIMSQPYILALMIQEANLHSASSVLEIGTGSGYGAALLSTLVDKVYSIDIIDDLSVKAQALLRRIHCNNVALKTADGLRGWEEGSPFDSILMTASTLRIPNDLLTQLSIGGTLIAPIAKSSYYQEITKIVKKGFNQYVYSTLLPVRFVRLT